MGFLWAAGAYNHSVSGLREDFLLDPTVVYLNHGSFGATPKPVFEAYQRWQRQLERQPTEFLGRRYAELLGTARQALGAFVGSPADDVVFVQNATQAVNILGRSLALGPEDEVLATNHEYGACDRMWRFLASRAGFSYTRRPIALPLDSQPDVVEEFLSGITERTRVIFVSQISSPTAILFPIEQICRRARDAGILTIIDGAHGPGQVELDLRALGADFYVGNLHKWLCAPKGAGFLYARHDVQALLQPLVVSWGYESELPSGSTFIDHHEWWGTRDLAAFLAVPAAIEYQRDHGWDQVRRDSHRLLRAALTGLQEITQVGSIYPDESWFVQMAVAPLPPHIDASVIKRRLYDEFRVEAPIHSWNEFKLIRISIQGYNNAADLDQLLRAMRKLLS